MFSVPSASLGSAIRRRQTQEAPTHTGRPRLARPTTATAHTSAPAARRAVLLGVSLTAAALLASRHALRGLALALPLPQRAWLTADSPGVFAAMHNQDWLVNHLKRDGVVKHPEVEAAMRQVDRGHYVDRGIPHAYIYQDSPLPIGYHETISAPHMHATCLELLREHLGAGARVLDVGSGSGYLSAAMGLMVGPTGKVVGIEKHPELAEQSVKNVRADHPELLDNGVVELRAGNVLGNVLEREEPFDAIHVGAAASSLPDVLVQKLKPGGRMVIPVGPQWEYQVMQCIDKDTQGSIHKHNLMHVRYVPLTRPGESDWEP